MPLFKLSSGKLVVVDSLGNQKVIEIKGDAVLTQEEQRDLNKQLLRMPKYIGYEETDIL